MPPLARESADFGLAAIASGRLSWGVMTRWPSRAGLALVVFSLTAPFSQLRASEVCATCHADRVKGYSRSAMAQSLRRPAQEPEGAFEHPASGTKFTASLKPDGYWQRRERDGAVSNYRIEYVIGSGKHAEGYIVRVGNHLFQSPITYYPRIHRYDMAPGYEMARTPDFIRPLTLECVLCHAGEPRHIAGTLSEYESPAFGAEAITCDRCHGDPAKHLENPGRGTIVNPAKLPPALRSSVCEQCHLTGAARVTNPGKKFQDFLPGQRLEEIFTIYTATLPAGAPQAGLKVISHSEQLAVSRCSIASPDQMWCGTCHDPHDLSAQPASYYRERCLACHAGTLEKTHAGGRDKADCVACHMARRNAKDGGHTVFTDHHISRMPLPDTGDEQPRDFDLKAWREPPTEFRQRNLALAYASSGFEHGSATRIVRGLHMLEEAEKQFPDDPEVLAALGTAYLAVRQPRDAVLRLERVVELRPSTSLDEASLGAAWLGAGRMDKALPHLERAVERDPLLFTTVEALMQVYQSQGDEAKAMALAERVRQALGSAAPLETNPKEP